MNKLQLCWPMYYVILTGPNVEFRRSHYEYTRGLDPSDLFFKNKQLHNFTVKKSTENDTRVVSIRIGEAYRR